MKRKERKLLIRFIRLKVVEGMFCGLVDLEYCSRYLIGPSDCLPVCLSFFLSVSLSVYLFENRDLCYYKNKRYQICPKGSSIPYVDQVHNEFMQHALNKSVNSDYKVHI